MDNKNLSSSNQLPQKPLWRYMDLSKFLSILEFNKLFFPAAIALPDKAEGLPYDRKSLHIIKALRWLSHQNTNSNHSGNTNEKLPEESENEIQEYRKNFVLISSWHSAEHESYGMWKAYIAGFDGICIKTSAKSLEKSFEAETDKNLKPRFSSVTYCAPTELTVAKSSYLDHFLKKSNPYSYEQEVRGIVDLVPEYYSKSKKWDDEQFKNLILNKGLYIKTDPKILIEKVIISPFSHPWLIQFVKQIIKRYDINEKLVEESELQH